MSKKHADQLVQVLEDEIASGLQPPGTRLEEVALAARFGVSRTPVREALRLLSASGLIELRPRRGAVVATLSLERLVEMFEAMAELEAICGRLAARRMSDAERRELERCHALCGEAAASADTDSYYWRNAAFHGAIYAGSHNSYLAEEARKLRRRLQPYRRLQLRLRRRVADSYAEHSAVVEAILAGEEEAASEALRAHVTIQSDRFADWLSSLNAERMVAASA